MRSIKKILLLVLEILFVQTAFPDTFIVTNSNNSGPGSLRDAIDQANRNGTAVTDFIHFNIPNTRGDITITIPVDDLLPALTSNIVIDGTTQPGALLGASNAKVPIAMQGRYTGSDPLYVFLIQNVSNVSIYGLFIHSLLGDGLNPPPDDRFAILLRGASNCQFGAANKGNVISGWNKAVFSQDTPQFGTSSDIKVQGNILGLDIDGVSTTMGGGGGRGGAGSVPATNNFGAYFERDFNTTIGGPNIKDGNIINSSQIDIYSAGLWWFSADGTMTISRNKIGIDVNGNNINSITSIGIRVRKFSKRFSLTRGNLGILISYNQIGGTTRQKGIYMDSIQSFFAIENNTLGAEVNGNPVPGSNYGIGIHLVQCDIGIIGSDNFGRENIIRYWKNGAVVMDSTGNVTFRYNSTYCNKKRAYELNHWKEYNPTPVSRPQPFVTVNYIDLVNGVVEGTATPNSWVDLYIDDGCPDCEGKTHLGGMFAVILVRDDGHWNYSDGPLDKGIIVATSTDMWGTTSEYSAPRIDTSSLNIGNIYCSGQNGSICGIKILSGTHWQWIDANGTVVGTDTCLSNVGPGRYFFKISIGAVNCEEMYSFTIHDSILKIDTSSGIRITHTRCGKSNGTIRGLKPVNASRWQWEDANGNIVGTDSILQNVSAGRYRFRVFNPFCDTVTTLYEITDVTPRIDVSNVVITPTTCGKKNGSITGIRFTGTAFSNIRWYDLNRNNAGTSTDLTNLGPGQYKMVIVDLIEGCGDSTIYFRVDSMPSPTLVFTNAVINHATCNQTNGSITNVTTAATTGAVVFSWVNDQNRVVGNTLDLLNIKAGRYRLKMKDAGTCDTIVSPTIEILNNGNITIDAAALNIRPTGCNRINGSITGISVSGATSWEWRSIPSNNVVSSNQHPSNLPAGDYQLFAMNNVYGCSVQSAVYHINVAGPLPLTVTKATEKDASCNLNNGSISIDQLSNNSNYFTYRWLMDSTSQVGTALSLNGLVPAVYHLMATDTNGCEKAIYKRTIIMQPLPVLNESAAIVRADTCDLRTGSITGIRANSAVGNIQYRWVSSFNSVVGSSPDLRGLNDGTYRLEITDINGCKLESREYMVEPVTTILPAPRYDEVTIPRNGDATLRVKNFVSGGIYELYDANSGALIERNNSGVFKIPSVPDNREYLVKLVSGPCSSEPAQVSVKVIDITNLEIPNAFTPNGDGINDEFRIKVTGYFKLNNLRIFNRYGQLIFETRDLSREWKGYLNSNPVPVGTYYWTLEGIDVQGHTLRKSGSVTLIR